MKHESVQSLPETILFDNIASIQGVSKTIYQLLDSIIELRDFQYVVRDSLTHIGRCTNAPSSQIVLDYLVQVLTYYSQRMHITDANVLQQQYKKILVNDTTSLSIETLYTGMVALLQCVDTMCSINTHVIHSSLRK
jgi:hypothetical protein